MALWRTSVIAVLDEHFPLAVGVLQSVQIKSEYIIEEVAFDLATKNINP